MVIPCSFWTVSSIRSTLFCSLVYFDILISFFLTSIIFQIFPTFKQSSQHGCHDLGPSPKHSLNSPKTQHMYLARHCLFQIFTKLVKIYSVPVNSSLSFPLSDRDCIKWQIWRYLKIWVLGMLYWSDICCKGFKVFPRKKQDTVFERSLFLTRPRDQCCSGQLENQDRKHWE